MSFPVSTTSTLSAIETLPLAPRPNHPRGVDGLLLSPAISSEPVVAVVQNSAFSKTWVLPPRKKPGRKAANDVPPTKRQAQNRAAQKAFRDRKALRVVELEKENEELRERIESMEAELNAMRKTPNSGHQDQERAHGNTPGQQLASPAPSASVNCETCVVGKNCTCLNDVAGADTQTKQASDDMDAGDNDDTCGLCSGTSCLCEELGIRNRSGGGSTSKRKRSKSHETTSSNAQLFSMETDFTSSFHCITPPNRLPGGTCGFCPDPSACVCLDDALQSVQIDEHTFATITAGANTRSESQTAAVTPTSGDGESRNPPGTCIQCRSDPISTLFCQTLSRRLESPVPLPLPSQQQSSTDQRPTQATYLQCSAVYQTLSRHRNFDKMSLEVIVDGLARGEHRGMEFAVGGVHGLLREMDRGETSRNHYDL